ncbi:hypothetical protein ACYQR9_21430 [Methylobacterium sp. CM6241]
MEPYILALAGFGTLVLLTAWLPMVLKQLPLSLPICCVGIGAALPTLFGLTGTSLHPQEHLGLVERLSELVVIVSLMGAGLKLDRLIGWKRWIVTWRLLGIAMPLTILERCPIGLNRPGFRGRRRCDSMRGFPRRRAGCPQPCQRICVSVS